MSKRNRRLVFAFIVFDLLLLGGFALYTIPSPISDTLHQTARRVRAEAASLAGGTSLPVRPVASRVSSADGMTQIFVPAGEFLMGSEEQVPQKNRPLHRVRLPAFWMDQTEVTNAMYARCVAVEKCPPPMKQNPFYGQAKYDDHPVVYVSWDAADRYCRWAGRRLPTEAEWEKAARGADGRSYPWGNDLPDIRLANFDMNVGASLPVDRYPLGASPYGALNMAGNVREWVADWFHEFYYLFSPFEDPQGPPGGRQKSLRGGSYLDGAVEIRVFQRFSHAPASPGVNRGFRCASSE